MKKLKILAVVMMCALGLSVGVQTAIGAEATVTQATVQSFFVDEDGIFYPATCDETQVINGNQRKEMFHCTFDAAVPANLVCDTSVGCRLVLRLRRRGGNVDAFRDHTVRIDGRMGPVLTTA